MNKTHPSVASQVDRLLVALVDELAHATLFLADEFDFPANGAAADGTATGLLALVIERLTGELQDHTIINLAALDAALDSIED